MAKRIVTDKDGLTLTGLVRKAMHEATCASDDWEKMAEHVAGRLVEWTDANFREIRAENERLNKRLKMACDLAKKKDGEIGRLLSSASYAAEMSTTKDKEIERLRAELQRQGMIACAHCSAAGEERRIRDLLRETERCCDKHISDLEEELVRLRDQKDLEIARLLSSASYATEQISKATAEAKDKEIERLNDHIKGMRRGCDECASLRMKACSDCALGKEKEIERLRAAFGKKSGRSDRLGKKISALNEEIHRLRTLLDAIRLKYEGNNVKSFARMASDGPSVRSEGVTLRMEIHAQNDGAVVWSHVFSQPKTLCAGDSLRIEAEIPACIPIDRVVLDARAEERPKPAWTPLDTGAGECEFVSCPPWDKSRITADKVAEMARVLHAAIQPVHPMCRCAQVYGHDDLADAIRYAIGAPSNGGRSGYLTLTEDGLVACDQPDWAILCPDCGRIVPESGHDCPERSE